MRKWLNFCGGGSTLKKEAGSKLWSFWLWGVGSGSIFHKTCGRDVEA